MFKKMSNFVRRHPIGWSLFLTGISAFCAMFCLGSVVSHLAYAQTLTGAFSGAAFPMFLFGINAWSTVFNMQALLYHLKNK